MQYSFWHLAKLFDQSNIVLGAITFIAHSIQKSHNFCTEILSSITTIDAINNAEIQEKIEFLINFASNRPKNPKNYPSYIYGASNARAQVFSSLFCAVHVRTHKAHKFQGNFKVRLSTSPQRHHHQHRRTTRFSRFSLFSFFSGHFFALGAPLRLHREKNY